MQGLATESTDLAPVLTKSTGLAPVSTRFQSIKMADRSREQMLSMASMLVSLVDLRDCYTGGHSTRGAEDSPRIALGVGLGGEETEMLLLAGSLHGVGKNGVPEHILLKPGRLAEDEIQYNKKAS